MDDFSHDEPLLDAPAPECPAVAEFDATGRFTGVRCRCIHCGCKHWHSGFGVDLSECRGRPSRYYYLRPARNDEHVDLDSPDPQLEPIPYVDTTEAPPEPERPLMERLNDAVERGWLTVAQAMDILKDETDPPPPPTPEEEAEFERVYHRAAENLRAKYPTVLGSKDDDEVCAYILAHGEPPEDPDGIDLADLGRRLGHEPTPADIKWWRDGGKQGGRPFKQKPEIRMWPGKLDDAATAAQAALLDDPQIPIFQRGRDLVLPGYQLVQAADGRTVLAPCLVRVDQAGLMDLMCRAATWYKPKGHVGPQAEADWVFADPKDSIARIILSRFGRWPFPDIAGVVSTPTLRPDGSILATPGYDEQTRLYLMPDRRLILPPIPEKPTRAHALAALELLGGLLAEFPLVGPVDVSVALSGLMTPVVRAAMPVAPLHAFRANSAGSGKSYLVDLCSAIATGRICPVSAANDSDEEAEKHLVGLLLSGFPIISLDNIDPSMTLGSGLLCQAVERSSIRVRALGRSDIQEIAATVAAYTTGNNLTMTGDMTRRTLIATMDAAVERPELRAFKGNPVNAVMANRGRYVAACLTIARAYLAAGKPGRLNPVASYEAWSDLVRSPLVWLGCADPAESMNTARAEDPKLAALAAVLAAWESGLGTVEKFTTKELIAATRDRYVKDGHDEDGREKLRMEPASAGWKDALPAVCEVKGSLDAGKLGYWLRANAGRVVNGLRIEREGIDHSNSVCWRLAKMR